MWVGRFRFTAAGLATARDGNKMTVVGDFAAS